ncbi:uncharacterized protein DUF1232 [Paucimonas lemoignei]|uniref:Uncharacterized protein DUF1232 n=1 Tax=Paucimonas lemoignei TaxID=29443 RepID=A0A4R3HTD6_PAULE|nr:YkvA family protein [Paucimonas lemoignei]TCS35743.1 uncharacterized protein DUF1232 [Paucimonas lemoignei]
MLEQLKARARQLKADTYVLYLAARHPSTPWHAKLLVAAVVAYALSPIDLIPDFIPVLGYLDDLVLVPIGIALAIRLIPETVLADCRKQAAEAMRSGKLQSRSAAAVIIVIWVVLATTCAIWLYKNLSR